ncbi:MAG: hypothetical protein IIB57_06670 [Planctomycetes bacterium]|nr:hypothetical protein [Planctomycetota bacterium]
MGCIPVVTRNLFTVVGGELTFQYTFEVDNSLSSIVVETLEPNQTNFTAKVLDTDYTIDTAAKIVTFVSTTTRGAVGTIIQIRRCTERARGINWNSEAAFSPATANRDQQQDFSFQQELETELSDVLHRNDRRDEWDAEALEGGNAAPARSGNSWVTLNQLNAAIFDGEVIDLNEPLVLVFTGDGATTTFTLPGARGTTAQMWFVYKNGVHQNSDDSTGGVGVYTITVTPGQDDQIVFEDAPEDGTSVLCTILQGTVVGLIADDSVTRAMLQDDIVGLDQMNIGSGDALRFLVFDTDGDPVGRVAVHGDISDFDAGVRENRLDQMAVPTANVSMNNRKLTTLASGSASGDAVTIGQLPTNPARLDTTGISDPVLGTTRTIVTGFAVKHVALTFGYRTEAGEVIHATAVASFTPTDTIRHLHIAVTDSSNDVKFIRVKLSTNANGWVLVFNASTWNAVSGLFTKPKDVSAISYGAA